MLALAWVNGRPCRLNQNLKCLTTHAGKLPLANKATGTNSLPNNMARACNNHVVVDLKKVQHANLVWVNQEGMKSQKKPGPTVFGVPVTDELALHIPEFPGETLRQRAERRGMLDTWTPRLYLQLSANNNLVYSGPKALSLWQAWKARIFGSN